MSTSILRWSFLKSQFVHSCLALHRKKLEVSVTQVLEEVVNTVEGLSELRSSSGQGTAGVFPTFNLDRNIETATQDVRDRVATVIRLLPPDAIPRRLQRATATRIPRFPLR